MLSKPLKNKWQRRICRISFSTTTKLNKVRYRHTNIVAKDWRKVAKFYKHVFGMTVVGSERNLKGDFLDKGVGYKNATIKGVHMKMPGYDEYDSNIAPTLEIFEYDGDVNKDTNIQKAAIYDPGFGHLAFEVDDIEIAVMLVIKNGGSMLSDNNQISSHNVIGQGTLKWCYVRDNEDNIIELQQWDIGDLGS